MMLIFSFSFFFLFWIFQNQNSFDFQFAFRRCSLERGIQLDFFLHYKHWDTGILRFSSVWLLSICRKFFFLSLPFLSIQFFCFKQTDKIYIISLFYGKKDKKMIWMKNFMSFFLSFSVYRILFVSRKLYWLSISLSLSLSLLLDLCVFAIWTLTHTHTHNENVTKQPNEKERKRSIFNSTNNNNPYTNCIIFSFKK